jgi:hypothetical protein
MSIKKKVWVRFCYECSRNYESFAKSGRYCEPCKIVRKKKRLAEKKEELPKPLCKGYSSNYKRGCLSQARLWGYCLLHLNQKNKKRE